MSAFLSNCLFSVGEAFSFRDFLLGHHLHDRQLTEFHLFCLQSTRTYTLFTKQLLTLRYHLLFKSVQLLHHSIVLLALWMTFLSNFEPKIREILRYIVGKDQAIQTFSDSKGQKVSYIFLYKWSVYEIEGCKFLFCKKLFFR